MLKLIKPGNGYCLKIFWVQVGYFASVSIFMHHFISCGLSIHSIQDFSGFSELWGILIVKVHLHL